MFDPMNVETYLDRGVLFAGRGDYETAIDEFTKAIGRNPVFTAAYLLRGKVLLACICTVDNRRRDFNALKIGQLKKDVPPERVDKAIADFNRARKLDPVNQSRRKA
jgi:tetratricopeptide (TPR) repeat protein